MAVLKYMILDNDHINSHLLMKILNRIGKFNYEVFTSPSKLLDTLKFEKPDIIFCNVTTRGCDPRELLKAKLDIPLIFISVLNPSEERRKEFLNSGYPYITSPLNVNTIAAFL